MDADAKPGPDAPDRIASSESGATDSSAQKWKLTEELFHRAQECAAEERIERLKEWCGADVELLESVLALLEADSAVEDLLSTGAPGDDGRFLKRGGGAGDLLGAKENTDEDPWLGRVLGAFRLDRLIGRGGMGVVYKGERISGGFTQTVAVKLMGQHLRSSPAVNQFLLERETLAHLEHANIARLLDGGVTSEGFPYVVMEFVEGERLDSACDNPATTIEQIIRWMQQLCYAVAYVHRNLILHRDLKPGNVMVTGGGAHAGPDEGQVKLLDFGTLKRIGPEGDTDSAMTQAGMRPVTLRYASPEHIEGAKVSTAADVYSLGMILYRLIAGRLPEELDDLPIALYLERLRKGGFKPPSQLAMKRSPARKIDAQVARDLDAIVAKAIRYEPEARYASADALAGDLWNVLLYRPVSARDGSLRYIAAKLYRRYRWPFRAAAAALLVLAAGLSAMAWQGHIAHLQELRAVQGVEDERQLAHMLLFDYFEQLNLIPGSVAAQKKAVTQALAYLDNLARLAPGSALDVDTIRGFTDMGNLLGNPYDQNLGDVPGAIQSLNRAVTLAKARAEQHPRDFQSLELLIRAEDGLAGTYLGNGDAIDAEQVLKPALQTAAEMSRMPHATPAALQMASSAADLMGDVYDPTRGNATANMDKARQFYELSDKYDEMCDEADPKTALCSAGIVVGAYKLGSLIEDTDPVAAAADYRHGLDVVMHYPPEQMKTTRSHRFKNYMLSRLGLMEMRIGRMAQGIAMAREAQAGFRELIARAELDNRAHFDLVAFETDLAEEYDRSGRETDAAETAHEVLGILSVLLQRSPGNLRWQMIQAQDLMTLGRIETKLGDKATGREASQKGLEQAVRLAQAKDASPEALGLAADGLLTLHRQPGDAQLALVFAQRATGAFVKPMPAQLLTLAKAQAAAGKTEEAGKTAQLVLTALTGPVKSRIVAEQIADAHRLVVQ